MAHKSRKLGSSLPTAFQRETCWNALTLVAITVIAVIVVGLIVLVTRILAFLQPLLVPLAVAAIIGYLLDPLVKRLQARGQSNFRSVLVVFTGFMVFMLVLFFSVVPASITQATELLNDKEAIIQGLQKRVREWPANMAQKPTFKPLAEAIEKAADNPDNFDWLKDKFPALAAKAWSFVTRSFGFLGYVLGLFLVPIYLFFFLKESQAIKQQWTDYLPIKASKFKDEVVGVLQEINGYLIAFFRGQMMVSVIDGALVTIGLLIIGMPYAILIGVFVALLGIIPYIGNLMCLIPALAISIWHYGEPANQIFGIQQLWMYPLIVLGIFTLTQQLNSLVTAPRIVGDSVGLHPLTIIFSVLFWSLLIGGFLGSLLAVPLTASIKVLFRRYIWEMQFKHESPPDDGEMA
jgi:predicted PurR-regulated permease PerM